MKEHGLIYLAQPYRAYVGGLAVAYEHSVRMSAELVRRHACVYAPIAHMHNIALNGGLDPYDDDLWVPMMDLIMKGCDTLFIATLPGWTKSAGTAHELSQMRGKPVFLMDPYGFELSPF